MTDKVEDSLYAFVFRAQLTETALQKTGAIRRPHGSEDLDPDVVSRLSLDVFDDDTVHAARRMATVYTAISSFENTLRRFLSSVMLENCGASWWKDHVSEKIQRNVERRQDEESKIKWHGNRGQDPIYYADFGDSTSIVIQNWALFEPHFITQDWIKNIISTVERSRNVIMHSGTLENPDIERLGTVIRDWVRQVGT